MTATMQDKICVVTGANTGIGFEIALGLAKAGAHVVMVCRDIHKGNDAKDKIEEIFPDADIYLVVGDLSSNGKTKDLAYKIIKEYEKVDLLIHNAGVWPTVKKVNEDGLEEAFCVNHLSSFYLTHLLLDKLRVSAPSRVIFLNSGIHTKAYPLDLSKTPYGMDFSRYSTYRQTNLCSVLCLRKWSKYLELSNVTVNMVDPGSVNTQLGSSNDMLGWVHGRMKARGKTPEQGAEAPLWLATAKHLADISGNYYNEEKAEMVLAENAADEEMQNEIWALSLRLCKLHAEQVEATNTSVLVANLLDL